MQEAQKVESSLETNRFSAPNWATIVWNDPINTMQYVETVFMRHFGYSQANAHALMMRVHVEGSAQVSQGAKERMEADVLAMHGFGLRATIEPVENA
ncbi:ATP-dependent Clp protease adapter ClpS [Gleimia sp. 6138-11-ORH1]|uniref:ATP-dependent Clp protease adapter ClpS n=1 Tax=Gleimia sp. 6138-11-ORH1 TaxID=2973937 RepID=UPI002169FD12|nr:ATP-dependent Clp protease adapter ClpS [Gleimia sp. 6138-11-ORH1]MCS4483893.1 ATP-dependent Clp protease adapter ClpS [Gleimia sp. 6138-11-ORH1]